MFQVQPGEQETLQWGLVSDEDTPRTLTIDATGPATELLSFPKTVYVEPHQTVYVNVTVAVPANHPNNVKLTAGIHATQYGESGGSTIINIRMAKLLTVNIGNPPIETPSQSTSPTQTQNPTPSTQNPPPKQNPSSTTIITSTNTSGSSGGGAKGGGCLIATAAFGSELAPQIQQLRETRDNVLLSTQSGTTFMTGFNQFYYTFSPTVADWERENPVFKEIVRASITPLIATLSILNYIPIHSEAEMLVYGIGIIALNVGMYFVAPAAVIVKLKHRK